MENRPRYANWVPSKVILLGTALTLALLLAARAAVSRSRLVGGILLLATAAVFALTFYMLRARTALSYEGGGVQGKVLDGVLNHLNAAGFDGHGRLLDIGCGSGAMSVKAAKRYPKALITGLDFWGKSWDYSQALCEENARLEGVAGRITFRQGDAAKLPFVDGAFDAAVSNFVFHEVRTQPDKHALGAGGAQLHVRHTEGAVNYADGDGDSRACADDGGHLRRQVGHPQAPAHAGRGGHAARVLAQVGGAVRRLHAQQRTAL